jgi:hypothetical protein
LNPVAGHAEAGDGGMLGHNLQELLSRKGTAVCPALGTLDLPPLAASRWLAASHDHRVLQQSLLLGAVEGFPDDLPINEGVENSFALQLFEQLGLCDLSSMLVYRSDIKCTGQPVC